MSQIICRLRHEHGPRIRQEIWNVCKFPNMLYINYYIAMSERSSKFYSFINNFRTDWRRNACTTLSIQRTSSCFDSHVIPVLSALAAAILQHQWQVLSQKKHAEDEKQLKFSILSAFRFCRPAWSFSFRKRIIGKYFGHNFDSTPSRAIPSGDRQEQPIERSCSPSSFILCNG